MLNTAGVSDERELRYPKMSRVGLLHSKGETERIEREKRRRIMSWQARPRYLWLVRISQTQRTFAAIAPSLC